MIRQTRTKQGVVSTPGSLIWLLADSGQEVDLDLFAHALHRVAADRVVVHQQL